MRNIRDEKSDSEFSEIESQLNMGKDDNSYFDYKPDNKRTNRMTLFTSDTNTSENVERRTVSFCSDDGKSILHGSSIENYSILDNTNFKNINEMTHDATFEASFIRQGNSESTQNMKSPGILSKVIKKPVKDQVIDFNVPIYTDVKKKKTTMKPHALNAVNMKQYEISKTHSDKCESLKANKSAQNISKCTLPKTKISVSKKDFNSSKVIQNFVDASTLAKYMDETTDDQAEYKMKEKYGKRKSVSFSPEKKVVKNQKKNPKCLQIESNENAKLCDCQSYTTSSQKRIKVRNNLVYTDKKHEAKEDCPMESEARKKLNDKKIEKNKQIVSSKVDRCKRSNYYDRSTQTRILNDIKVAESSNEDMMPVQHISMENATFDSDHGKLLNVNIVCPFYKEEDQKTPSIEYSKAVICDMKTSVKNTEKDQDDKHCKKIITIKEDEYDRIIQENEQLTNEVKSYLEKFISLSKFHPRTARLIESSDTELMKLNGSLILIPDTNLFMGYQSLIRKLKNLKVGHKTVNIVVACEVVNELDKLKGLINVTGQRARQANRFLRTEVCLYENCYMQSIQQQCCWSTIFNCPGDGRFFECAYGLLNRLEHAQVYLLSNDVNFYLQADSWRLAMLDIESFSRLLFEKKNITYDELLNTVWKKH